MAKALRGSMKNKRDDDSEPELEPEKRPDPASTTDEEKLALSDAVKVESEHGCGNSGEGPDEIIPDDLEIIESDSLLGVDGDEYTFQFNKNIAGASTIVTVLKFDSKGIEVDRLKPPPFPNITRADEWINGELAKIKEAKEKREDLKNQGLFVPSVYTPKYGNGVVLGSPGELVITARCTKDVVVVIPELVDDVVKWLNGREVAAHRVSNLGLHIVTFPDYQRATFTLLGNEKVQVRLN
jgi:hypothetical protein